MKRGKYLAQNVGLFALGNIGTKMISFFLLPLYTNVLSTTQYGTIDLVFTICNVVVPIITFNIGESVMRFSLDKDADHDRIQSIGMFVILISLVLGVIGVPAAFLFDTTKSYCLYIYLYSVSLGISQIVICNLRGKELLLDYAISNIIHTITIAIFNILFLLYFRWGVIGYFVAYILSNVITIIYASVRGKFFNVIRHFSFDKDLFFEMIKYSLVLIPTSFMWWIMNSSDRIMVTAMIGVAANGIYAISYKVPNLLSTFSTIFNQAWSYSAIKENESLDRVEYNNLVYDRMVRILVICTAGLILVMKPFLKIYVSENYYEAWKYTPFLLIGLTFTTLGTFLSTSYTVNKDSKGFLFSGMTGAGINVLLNALLIPTLGVYGAAIATCISYISTFAYRAIDTHKYLPLKILRKDHLVYYSCLVIMGGSMFVDGIQGLVLLFVEFCVVLFFLRQFVKEFVAGCISMILRKKRE